MYYIMVLVEFVRFVISTTSYFGHIKNILRQITFLSNKLQNKNSSFTDVILDFQMESSSPTVMCKVCSVQFSGGKNSFSDLLLHFKNFHSK